MPDRRRRITVDANLTVDALVTEAPAARWTLIYAPGAGSNLNDAFGAHLAKAVAPHRIRTVRFEFPYMQPRPDGKRRGPDRPPVLEATWRAVIDAARTPDTRLVVGGRSMGGRIASQVVAQGASADAVTLFAYPLHPPGKPDQRRDAHLDQISVPVLFCSGTRDAFAAADELHDASKKMRRATVRLLDGADHGFAVPKAGGRTKTQIFDEAVAGFLAWLGAMK